ncbi:hypothetical protein PTTG_11267 [Puccinia triticina 1-1 BBBD Race 1]|uniref:Uncharacterized protein n=1 Tax=Puccinia triticina (isolate 1-1 / race 1 (BBBD)) TaxID=630390 RepID=A0A0C4FDG2_PUCT1|nr:hypothetical protein PTTG_11267 [Puccinia triticina 1-1 BBBD Race 1]
MLTLASQRPDPQAQRRPNYAERIAKRLFPSREEMAAQTTAELELNRERVNNDTRMVDASIALASAMRKGLGASGDPDCTDWQTRRIQLDLEFCEIKIARVRASLEAERSTGAAFDWAKMVQDFIQSGLNAEEALSMTERFLGPEAN